MDLHALVKQARSVRRYDQNAVIPYSQMEAWVECARCTPSASNAQPLRYRIVSDPADFPAVFEGLAWAGALPEWPGPAEGERPGGYIVICSEDGGPLTSVDVGIASQTIMLVAASEGIGACMFKSFSKRQILDATGIDGERYNIELVMSFGVPAETVVLEPLEGAPKGLKYWRTEDEVHHVPKRALEDVLI